MQTYFSREQKICPLQSEKSDFKFDQLNFAPHKGNTSAE